MRMMRTAALALGALMTVACGGGGGGGGTPPPPTVASLELSPASGGSLASLGDQVNFSVVARDAGGTVMPNASVTWSIVPPGAGTLSPTTGLTSRFTAAANGTAKVYATSGSVRDSATIAVAQVFASLAVNPTSFTKSIGQTQQVTATARDARGNSITGTAAATQWSSSDDTRVTVSPAVGSATTATMVADGSAAINASLTVGGVTRAAASNATISASFPSTATVNTGAAAFIPPSTDIAAAGQVQFNIGGSHNLVWDSPPFPIAGFAQGVSGSRTFANAGTYNFHCEFHGAAGSGMNGSVVVH